MSDLKEVISLLPKVRGGRGLTLNYDKSGYWYVGYPNQSWDFSVDIHANERDIEGACLNLLSQVDAERVVI